MKKLTTDSAYDPSADHRVVDQAYATCRVLEGSADSGYAEEWVERIEQDGMEYDIYYLFGDEDIIDGDGTPKLAENYPWDDDHISKIEEVEK